MERKPILRWSRRLLILVGVFVLTCAGYYGWWASYGRRVVTVAEDKVYQSAQMPPDELVAWCRDHGVDAVVDFRETEDDIGAQRSALQAAGLTYYSLPSVQIPTDQTVDAFLTAMDQCRDKKVLLHCQHGEGRSVLFGALYRVEYLGWTKDAAWRGSVRMPDSLKWANFERLRLSKDKKDYLLGYRRRGGHDGKQAPVTPVPASAKRDH